MHPQQGEVQTVHGLNAAVYGIVQGGPGTVW